MNAKEYKEAMSIKRPEVNLVINGEVDDTLAFITLEGKMRLIPPDHDLDAAAALELRAWIGDMFCILPEGAKK